MFDVDTSERYTSGRYHLHDRNWPHRTARQHKWWTDPLLRQNKRLYSDTVPEALNLDRIRTPIAGNISKTPVRSGVLIVRSGNRLQFNESRGPIELREQ